MAKVEEVREAGGLPVVGLSCFSSALYQSTMLLGAVVRARYPDLPILVGGHHPAFASESLMAYVGSEIPFVEGADLPSMDGQQVAGQGEEGDASDPASPRSGLRLHLRRACGPDLCRCTRWAEAAISAPGPACLSAAEPVLTGMRCGGSDTHPRSSTGWPWPSAAFNRWGSASASAVPNDARSASRAIWLIPGVRSSRKHAVDTLTLLQNRHGISHVVLGDANFGSSRAWRQQFLEAAVQANWARSLSLLCEVSVLQFDVDDPGLLDGLDLHLQVGVETASRQMLKRMRKAPDPDHYLVRLKRLIQEVSPHTTSMLLMLIVGFPGETKESLTESFRFLFEECRINDYPRVTIGAQPYLPLAGTESVALADRFADEFGFASSRVDWWFGAFDSRRAGLRPSSGLSLAYCEADYRTDRKGKRTC